MINKNIIIKPFFHLQIYQILSLHKILLLHRNIWSKIVTLKGIFYEIKKTVNFNIIRELLLDNNKSRRYFYNLQNHEQVFVIILEFI